MLETGYPRNDVLTSPGAAQTRARVRAELGVPDGVTAVLYTPTWRDRDYFDLAPGGLHLALPLEEFARDLGPGFCLLPRLHYKVTHLRGDPDVSGVVDVSYHPDVAELYLAADVLVTDYSSTMFDFAVTGKPMIFYAYDLAAYRDIAPGLLLRPRAGGARPGRQPPGRAGRRAAAPGRRGTPRTGAATAGSGDGSARWTTATRPSGCARCTRRRRVGPGDRRTARTAVRVRSASLAPTG